MSEQSGGMSARIEGKLQSLAPLHMVLLNESHQHSGPGAETHWNLVIVSQDFVGKRLLQRHRTVYGVLGDELRGGIHALTMKTLTPTEFAAQGGEVDNVSPPCGGGSKG